MSDEYLLKSFAEVIEEACFLHLEGDEVSICMGDNGLIEKPYSLRQKLIDQLEANDCPSCIDRLTATRDTLRDMLKLYDKQIERYAAIIKSQPL